MIPGAWKLFDNFYNFRFTSWRNSSSVPPALFSSDTKIHLSVIFVSTPVKGHINVRIVIRPSYRCTDSKNTPENSTASTRKARSRRTMKVTRRNLWALKRRRRKWGCKTKTDLFRRSPKFASNLPRPQPRSCPPSSPGFKPVSHFLSKPPTELFIYCQPPISKATSSVVDTFCQLAPTSNSCQPTQPWSCHHTSNCSSRAFLHPLHQGAFIPDLRMNPTVYWIQLCKRQSRPPPSLQLKINNFYRNSISSNFDDKLSPLGTQPPKFPPIAKTEAASSEIRVARPTSERSRWWAKELRTSITTTTTTTRCRRRRMRSETDQDRKFSFRMEKWTTVTSCEQPCWKTTSRENQICSKKLPENFFSTRLECQVWCCFAQLSKSR